MRLRYLLDTNICIYIAKAKPINVLQRFQSLESGSVAMSIITYGELLFGAEKSQHPQQAKATLEELANIIPPLLFSIEVGKYYAEVRAKLEKQGQMIGGNDLWIASHALVLDTTLVTNNIKEFSRISQLKIENWV
jgi:tRNA(fMet)-specific endonuclease VapC